MFPFLPIASLNEFTFFALVLGRLAGILSAIPLFGEGRVPLVIRVVTIFMVTLVCFPILQSKAPHLPVDSLSVVILVVRETLIGISLGLLSQALFAAVEFCGQIVGMQMGFSMSTMFDPSMGQTPLMSNVQLLLAMLLFLSLGVHHLFIRAIMDSYAVIPVGNWHMSGGLMEFLIATTGNIFVLGIKLAAPVMVALLATSVALGIMARSFPQMNIFMVSMPLNIGIGFLVLGLSLLIFLHTLELSFSMIAAHIKTLFKLLG
jgi:flagellar biosynthesis protein FliR